MYEENKFNPDNDEMLDELITLLGSIPKNTVTMLNIPKHSDAIRSITQIVKFVKEDFPEEYDKLKKLLTGEINKDLSSISAPE